MTTKVTITTHDWPVEVTTRDTAADGTVTELVHAVPPNDQGVLHLHATRSFVLREMPKPEQDSGD